MIEFGSLHARCDSILTHRPATRQHRPALHADTGIRGNSLVLGLCSEEHVASSLFRQTLRAVPRAPHPPGATVSAVPPRRRGLRLGMPMRKRQAGRHFWKELPWGGTRSLRGPSRPPDGALSGPAHRASTVCERPTACSRAGLLKRESSWETHQ